MRTCLTTVAASVMLGPAALSADEGDDTLGLLLSKSEIVITAMLTRHPIEFVDEVGVVNYDCRVKLHETIKGKGLRDGEFTITVVRFEQNRSDEPAFLKKDVKCIFFLKRRKGVASLETADGWFGVQPYNRAMDGALKRLVADDNK